MDTCNEKFLKILKSALLGENASGCDGISPGEWLRLFHLAGAHSVLPMFYEAVHAIPALQEVNAPFIVDVRRQTMQMVMAQTMRTNEFLGLNKQLQEAGVHPLVVKGIICRNLYPKPDFRQSSDEDLLIPEEQFDICHGIMTDYGLQTTDDIATAASSYEISYRKVRPPLYIELHKHLFPPESEAYGDLNRFFDHAFERAIVEDIQGSSVRTLGYTDHLFYLICHAFKHFLHSGFGIRQVCDLVLFANRYGTQIDWAEVLDNCCKINAERFAAALFRIGSNYLVFDPEKAQYPDLWRRIKVDETALLEDLLSSGVYGSSNLSRTHSSNITLGAVAAQKNGKREKNPICSSLFPPARKLAGSYPYLKKHPYLLPVAWCQRIRNYSRETRQTVGNTAASAVKIGKDRINLMKEYGILKK